MAWVLDRYEATVIDALVALPTTVIHGDCSASNVLVDRTSDRVCPIDWETTAVGPGVADVAALVSGWPDAERRSIALAYHDAAGGDPSTAAAFLADVDRCAVQLCVQWLGWSPGWVPPAEHRQDWLATAVTLLEGLS
jgi:thiamine kinase-like enzyme